MGMRQMDLIGIMGKTQDAAQAQQVSNRSHAALQDHIAVRQAAQAEQASEHISATAPEDRLELSTEGDGGGYGGGGGGTRPGEDEEPAPAPPAEEHQVDFLA